MCLFPLLKQLSLVENTFLEFNVILQTSDWLVTQKPLAETQSICKIFWIQILHALRMVWEEKNILKNLVLVNFL